MRTLSIILSICLLPQLFISCGNGWLDDVKPSTSVDTSESITSPEEAEYALSGIYYRLRTYYSYGARMTYYGDVKGDDMQANGETKRAQRYYFFTFNKDNVPDAFWTYPYRIIRNVHNILDYIDEIPADEMTDLLNNVKGEALTLRALSHFDLVRVFAMPYTKDGGASLGVPVITQKTDYTSKPARNTVKEVYDQMVLDLEEGSKYISKKRNNGGLNWYGNQLLLARIYLYMGNDKKAYEVATGLIEEATSNGYRLWTATEYPNVWSSSFTSEIFFQLVILAEEDGPGKEGIGYLMSRSGYDDIAITTDFMDLINEDPDDIRHSVISEYKGKYYTMKYPGNDGEGFTYADVPVLRLSEAYLIAAEAAVKENDNTNALKYLNAIVSRANPDKEVQGTVTLDRVLEERRKEFIGEGHRFFDAMRNNKRIERKGASHLSVLTNEARSFDWNWYKIVLPIPVDETNTNPNIKQNEGF